jgi:phosphinothricin acetyltransferase
MYVAPEFRGRGLGGELLTYVLDQASRMHGLRQVNLWVNATATSAVELYRAAGFEEIGIERAFLIVDGIAQDLALMVRVLRRKTREDEIEYQ